MTARFAVDGIFALRSRGLFVVHGRILEGSVGVGQHVTSPPGLEVPVEALEFVLLSAEEGREQPALGFRYRDESELTRWLSLGLAGQVLDLASP